MRPEGDHIGFGHHPQRRAPPRAWASQGNLGQVMLDIVFDYRRNDIGFFLSPGGGIQGNVARRGSLSAGIGGAARSWGTVASFGDRQATTSSTPTVASSSTSTYGRARASSRSSDGVQASTGGTFYPTASSTTQGCHRARRHDHARDTVRAPPRHAGHARDAGNAHGHARNATDARGARSRGTRRRALPDPGRRSERERGRRSTPLPPPRTPSRRPTRPGTTVADIEVTGHTSRGWRHLPPGDDPRAGQPGAQRSPRAPTSRARLRPAGGCRLPSPRAPAPATPPPRPRARRRPISRAEDQRASMSALRLQREATPGTSSSTAPVPRAPPGRRGPRTTPGRRAPSLTSSGRRSPIPVHDRARRLGLGHDGRRGRAGGRSGRDRAPTSASASPTRSRSARRTCPADTMQATSAPPSASSSCWATS